MSLGISLVCELLLCVLDVLLCQCFTSSSLSFVSLLCLSVFVASSGCFGVLSQVLKALRPPTLFLCFAAPFGLSVFCVSNGGLPVMSLNKVF